MKSTPISLLLFLLTAYTVASQTVTANKPADYIYASDGTKLFAKVSGKGPVCIFVHGGPGMWSKSFEVLKGNNLEKKLSMVYYDQRGSGRSDASVSKNYSIDRMIEDIEDIRRSLGVEKVYLMSHSFGGIIAANYAKKFPEHLNGLILLNSTLCVNNSIEGQIKYINGLLNTNFTITNSNEIFPVFSKAKNKLSEKGLEYTLLSESKKTVALLDSIDREKPNNNDFGRNVWKIEEYIHDFRPMTAAISIPVLVITGKKDYAIGVDHYKLFEFPNQKTVRIDGGHVLYYERNKEFTQAVFSFIESQQIQNK
ncbi:alpha/beta fold hydrolase [Flavobacterium sp.]|uniref:alpha/beta fold hydrolase n=1 Tax=Flavobacterium sp. TaxID=239 RepID=UPI003D6A3912